MGATAARWSVVVATETDVELRQFLASEGGGRKGDLSRFVEEAVKAQIFRMSAQRAKSENEVFRAGDIEDAVREALEWARRKR